MINIKCAYCNCRTWAEKAPKTWYCSRRCIKLHGGLMKKARCGGCDRFNWYKPREEVPDLCPKCVLPYADEMYEFKRIDKIATKILKEASK